MPGKLNGIEAARVIMEESDIPVVFVTSYADDAIIEKAKQVRPYGYIVKPFNELEIKAAIEVALFHKYADREKARLSAATEPARAGKVAISGRRYRDNLCQPARDQDRPPGGYLYRHCDFSSIPTRP